MAGIISTIVGKGEPGQVIEFEEISKSYLCGQAHEKGTVVDKVPHAVDVDTDGNVFIGETAVNRIRIADIYKNQVYTIAGADEDVIPCNNCLALNCRIGVHGLRVDNSGNLYFVDFHNNVVRVVKFTKE